jgi:hypothetical protein
MKALTIKQPWLALILAGHKHYEFRSWAPPITHGRVLLHAAASKLTKAEMGFYRTELDRCGLERAADALQYRDLLTGCFLAVATLAGSYDCADDIYCPIGVNHEPGYGPNKVTKWGELLAWHLTDIRTLGKPVPWKGQLGLWDVDWEVVRAAMYVDSSEVP